MERNANRYRRSDQVHAFQWLGAPVAMDEVECIIANLIFKGLIKGYISHQKRTLVLSKKEPFPTAAVRSNDTL